MMYVQIAMVRRVFDVGLMVILWPRVETHGKPLDTVTMMGHLCDVCNFPVAAAVLDSRKYMEILRCCLQPRSCSNRQTREREREREFARAASRSLVSKGLHLRLESRPIVCLALLDLSLTGNEQEGREDVVEYFLAKAKLQHCCIDWGRV